jgi:hypothetical protein
VRFYQEARDLVPALCGFVGVGLSSGDRAVLALLPSNEPLVRARLQACGADLRKVRFLDAEALAGKLGDRGVDADGLAELVGADLEWALGAGGSGRATIYGEIVDAFWRRGRESEAVALERVWDGFLRRRPIRLMCGYRIDPMDPRCAKLAELHDAVLPQPEQEERVARLERSAAAVLGSQLSMVRAMVHEEPRLRGLPFGLAALLWLGQHAPLLAGRVRALARSGA